MAAMRRSTKAETTVWHARRLMSFSSPMYSLSLLTSKYTLDKKVVKEVTEARITTVAWHSLHVFNLHHRRIQAMKDVLFKQW